MGVNINGGLNIGSGRTLISAPSIPPVNFNFTFDQAFTDPQITIQSIGGFTSNPPFTAKSGSFIFNSQGTSNNPITFNVTASRPGLIAVGQNFDLYKNGILLESLFVGFGFAVTQSFAYNPTTVSTNDSMSIYGYYPE